MIRTAAIGLTEGAASTTIGSDVTIGHMASLHGCFVGDRALVGMGATLLEGVKVNLCEVVATVIRTCAHSWRAGRQ